MPRRVPRVFVGSSSEAIGKGFAERFVHSLRQGELSAPILWRGSRDFDSTHSTLENLSEAAKSYDYGFFIFTADDRYKSRGQAGVMVRDNVLFEFGLFLGALGPDRVFAVVEEPKKEADRVKIPGDLWGIEMKRFKEGGSPSDTDASINEAVYYTREQIRRQGPRPLRLPIKRWGFDGGRNVFTVTLDHDMLKTSAKEIADGRLCIAVNRRDERQNPPEDPNIALSEARPLPRPLDLFVLDMTFEVKTDALEPEDGDILDAYLWLIPKDTGADGFKRMQDMVDAGSEMIAHVAKGVTKRQADE